MNSYIGKDLRRKVIRRAGNSCEYCLIHEQDTYFGCEIDHIVARKHGGVTQASNLAYACFPCNRFKGTDLASLSANSGQLVRLFNPRVDNWTEHFELRGGVIEGRTEIGIVTARLLQFNITERVLEREELISLGRYPQN